MFSFKDWLRRALSFEAPKARRRRRRRLAGRPIRRSSGVGPAPLFIEALEERIVFATRVWTGLGSDANWSTATNWVGNVVPQAEDNLVFPAAAARLANVNDFASATRFSSAGVG